MAAPPARHPENGSSFLNSTEIHGRPEKTPSKPSRTQTHAARGLLGPAHLRQDVRLGHGVLLVVSPDALQVPIRDEPRLHVGLPRDIALEDLEVGACGRVGAARGSQGDVGEGSLADYVRRWAGAARARQRERGCP